MSSQVFPNTPIQYLEGSFLAYCFVQVPVEVSLLEGMWYVFSSTSPCQSWTASASIAQEDKERDRGVVLRAANLIGEQLSRFHNRQRQIELAKGQRTMHAYDVKRDWFDYCKYGQQYGYVTKNCGCI